MRIEADTYYKTKDNHIVLISRDDFAESPREWDNVGKLFVDKHSPIGENEFGLSSWENLLEHYDVERSGYDMTAMAADINNIIKSAEARGDVILPVSTYEHGGISVFVGMPDDHFDGQWDCSFQGFIIAEKEDIEKEYGTGPDVKEKVADVLEGEIKDLDTYLNGDVYGFVEYDEKGVEVDSCWGFYGDDFEQNGLFDYSGKPVEELGNVYDYSSIEECIEDNQEKLGVVVDPLPSFDERVHSAERIAEDKNKDPLDVSVKEWYIETFPEDGLGEALNADTTFRDVAETLNNKEDIYDVIGVGDSVIRESVFNELADKLDVDYENVYEAWMGEEKIELDSEPVEKAGEER